MSISVKNLTKRYGSQVAVDALSFEVRKGEVIGFLGPNGAGKSTTMKMLTGYIEPSDGEAKISGNDIVEQSLKVRRVTGYLPENNPLYRDMYVKEYLSFIASLHKLPNKSKRVNELIERTGLGPEQHKRIGQLSKGYRQRVGLSQALIHDPEVLILDEPTSGLDPNQILDIRDLIITIGKEKTIVLSTHIMQEVQAMCDRVLIINRGKLVADGDIDELLNQSAGRNMLRLQFKNAVEPETMRKIKGLIEVKKDGKDYVLVSEKDDDLREAAFQWAVAQNNPILRMEQASVNLENVFQQLTAN